MEDVDVVHLTRGYFASLAIATRLPWTPSIRAFQSNAEYDLKSVEICMRCRLWVGNLSSSSRVAWKFCTGMYQIILF